MNLPDLIDIEAPKVVEVQVSHDNRRLWVNINGRCVLRCCKIENLVVEDIDPKPVLSEDANSETGLPDDHSPSDGRGQLQEGQA